MNNAHNAHHNWTALKKIPVYQFIDFRFQKYNDSPADNTAMAYIQKICPQPISKLTSLTYPLPRAAKCSHCVYSRCSQVCLKDVQDHRTLFQ